MISHYCCTGRNKTVCINIAIAQERNFRLVFVQLQADLWWLQTSISIAYHPQDIKVGALRCKQMSTFEPLVWLRVNQPLRAREQLCFESVADWLQRSGLKYASVNIKKPKAGHEVSLQWCSLLSTPVCDIKKKTLDMIYWFNSRSCSLNPNQTDVTLHTTFFPTFKFTVVFPGVIFDGHS